MEYRLTRKEKRQAQKDLAKLLPRLASIKFTREAHDAGYGLHSKGGLVGWCPADDMWRPSPGNVAIMFEANDGQKYWHHETYGTLFGLLNQKKVEQVTWKIMQIPVR